MTLDFYMTTLKAINLKFVQLSSGEWWKVSLQFCELPLLGPLLPCVLWI